MLSARGSHKDLVEKIPLISHTECVMLNFENEKCNVQSLRLDAEYGELNVEL